MDTEDPKALRAHYRRALARRRPWESHWAECYEYALPQRGALMRQGKPGEKKTERLFDATAPDAVDQLAANLLTQLTPPGARWFGLVPGPDAAEEGRADLAAALDRAAAAMQENFDRSGFAVEMHQGLLDAVVAGTACLLFEEADPGEPSAFRFAAVPLGEAVMEPGLGGRLDHTWRSHSLSHTDAAARFGEAAVAGLPEAAEGEAKRLKVLEAVLPDSQGYRYIALAEGEAEGEEARPLAEGRFATSPFINFRWLKAPGESYGRSPVMKALPDIKTANKVVELVLKNASIAVTGIWQADDDGVLNPANIRLVPGTIIPKAVGSAGLTPLQAPGRFDVSQLVLDDLRARIRHALMADRLGEITNPRMTATEVLERSAEMARMFGATYGRLQAELLLPLILRGWAILRRRGLVPDIDIDGRQVTIQYLSPLAQGQGRGDVQATLTWLSAVQQLGPEGLAAVDLTGTARWLGRSLGVPGELIRSEDEIAAAAGPEALMAGLGEILGQAGLDPAAVPAVDPAALAGLAAPQDPVAPMPPLPAGEVPDG